MACGDVLQRIIKGTLGRQYRTSFLRDFVQPLGQYGGKVRGGAELVAEQEMLGHQRGCTALPFDGVNAYNSVKRARTLPARAKHAPLVTGYTHNLYATAPPKLLFRTDDGRLQAVKSRAGVAQACNLGPLCYSTAMVERLREFRRKPPVEGATICGYISDFAIMPPHERARDMSSVVALTM